MSYKPDGRRYPGVVPVSDERGQPRHVFLRVCQEFLEGQREDWQIEVRRMPRGEPGISFNGFSGRGKRSGPELPSQFRHCIQASCAGIPIPGHVNDA
jgi:hypothetical protein